MSVYISKQAKRTAHCGTLQYVHLADRMPKWLSMQDGSQVHKFTNVAQ